MSEAAKLLCNFVVIEWNRRILSYMASTYLEVLGGNVAECFSANRIVSNWQPFSCSYWISSVQPNWPYNSAKFELIFSLIPVERCQFIHLLAVLAQLEYELNDSSLIAQLKKAINPASLSRQVDSLMCLKSGQPLPRANNPASFTWKRSTMNGFLEPYGFIFETEDYLIALIHVSNLY